MMRHGWMLGIFVLWMTALGCDHQDDSVLNNVQEKEETTVDTNLPPLEGQFDCEEPGFELVFEDWLQSGDGMVVGEVEKIEPALDIGRTVLPVDGGSDEDRIKGAEECVEIRNGYRLQLTNTRGFFHGGEDVPDGLALYFGSTIATMFPGRAPHIENGEITWPNGEPVLYEGMVIGGLVYHNEIVDRWSFRPGLGQPIFEIADNGLVFQETVRDRCGPSPPIESMTGLTREELETETVTIQHVIEDLITERLIKN